MPNRIVSLSVAMLMACKATAADWPQWRGPTRDDKSSETGLNKAFGDKAPPLVWKFDKAGIGYSGPSIMGGKVYLTGGT
ncbi:MAG: polyvinylalcohol dehydrogenase, partial [Planctomycetota bacterium]